MIFVEIVPGWEERTLFSLSRLHVFFKETGGTGCFYFPAITGGLNRVAMTGGPRNGKTGGSGLVGQRTK